MTPPPPPCGPILASDLHLADLAPCDLVFFGDRVRAWVPLPDVAELRFHYGDHVVAAPPHGCADLEVAAYAPGGFFASLLAKDRRPKLTALADGPARPLRLLARFAAWSGAPSILPPFSAARLRNRMVVTRGSVVQSPGGRTVALVGANHVGKTAVSLALLEAGWRSVSDHLVVAERGSGLVLPYGSPIGLRRRTLARFEHRLHGVATRSTISEVTGPVVLVRREDLFPGPAGGPAPLEDIVVLVRGDSAPRLERVAAPRLPTFPRSVVPPWAHARGWRLELPAGSDPAEAAGVLHRALAGDGPP